jgi:hypothetical protein
MKYWKNLLEIVGLFSYTIHRLLSKGKVRLICGAKQLALVLDIGGGRVS